MAVGLRAGRLFPDDLPSPALIVYHIPVVPVTGCILHTSLDMFYYPVLGRFSHPIGTLAATVDFFFRRIVLVVYNSSLPGTLPKYSTSRGTAVRSTLSSKKK